VTGTNNRISFYDEKYKPEQTGSQIYAYFWTAEEANKCGNNKARCKLYMAMHYSQNQRKLKYILLEKYSFFKVQACGKYKNRCTLKN
jgi:hypothetical protein